MQTMDSLDLTMRSLNQTFIFGKFEQANQMKREFVEQDKNTQKDASNELLKTFY